MTRFLSLICFTLVIFIVLFCRASFCQLKDFNFENKSPGLHFIKENSFNIYKERGRYPEIYGASENSSSETGDFFDLLEVNYKAGYLREIEELYSTNSFYQTLKVNKNFSEMFNLGFFTGIEYATRKEVELPDQTRWFDNTGLRANLNFNNFNTLSLFISGSISDTTLTTYGASLNSRIEADEVFINNFLTLSYDYFYYWNQVGQNFASDNVKITYRKFNLSAGYFFGLVDFNYVDGYDEKARNPNSSFSCDLNYAILKKPAVNFGVQFSTRNYKYYSPLYYSPQDRNIKGVSASLYDHFGKYYIYFGSGTSVDNNDTFIWNVDGEAGYDTGNFSVSAGISRYNDPYYTSYNTFLNIFKSF